MSASSDTGDRIQEQRRSTDSVLRRVRESHLRSIPGPERHAPGRNVWQEYEARKRELRAMELDPVEYQAAILRICRELGI